MNREHRGGRGGKTRQGSDERGYRVVSLNPLTWSESESLLRGMARCR